MSERVFKPGDRVQWCETTCTRTRVRMSMREGKVLEVHTGSGGQAVKCQKRNGRTTWLHGSELRFVDEPGHLTTFFGAGEPSTSNLQPSTSQEGA